MTTQGSLTQASSFRAERALVFSGCILSVIGADLEESCYCIDCKAADFEDQKYEARVEMNQRRTLRRVAS